MTPTSAAVVPWWFSGRDGNIVFGFTDARTDLGNAKLGSGDVESRRSDEEQAQHVARVLGDHVAGARVVHMNQVHSHTVALAEPGVVATADALIVDQPGTAALVRVADCVPIVITASNENLAAVVHAGRVGMTEGVVAHTCAQMRARGATVLRAWVGPRACGACYEVPQDMCDDVSEVEPAARSVSRWGTAALDVGAGVVAQLEREEVDVHDIGAGVCTIEDDAFWSFRRQHGEAGRFGAVARIEQVLTS